LSYLKSIIREDCKFSLHFVKKVDMVRQRILGLLLDIEEVTGGRTQSLGTDKA